MANSSSMANSNTSVTTNAASTRDNWSYRSQERRQAVVTYYDDYKPHGAEGVKVFFQCLSICAKANVPLPIDYFNIPPVTNGRARNVSLDEFRYEFLTRFDCTKFVEALANVDFHLFKVKNVVYVDSNASESTRDNASVWKKMWQNESGSKSDEWLGKSGEESTRKVWYKPANTFKKLLERLTDGSMTPIGGPSTPMKAWDREENKEKDESSASKKMKSGLDSIDDSSSFISDIGNKVNGAANGAPPVVEVTEEEKTPQEPEFPSTREEAGNRLDAINSIIGALQYESVVYPLSDAKKRLIKLEADKNLLSNAIKFYDTYSENNGMEWNGIDKVIKEYMKILLLK